ncbi:MFS transporter [Nocardia sp. NRRL S-836]|uniref:MFS transporter n=1 Tax=Nocardia sp. NRRL S-836 TaxID=1519492 RepID=UPI0006AF7D3B|nr:MFS transporter [Nocardia sp. NRRL S-836]KOV84048.1 MFS transporter [Nocardia sp. NRRL S-836]
MTRRLAYAQLTNSIGDGGFLVCSALYFTLVVGLSPAQVGLGLTVAWGVGAAAGVALGSLADRWGPRTTAVVLAVLTAASIAVLLGTRDHLVFVLVMCLYASCQSGLQAARQALLAGLTTPEERTRVRARIQATANAGIAIGAAAGGFALHLGTEIAYTAVFALDALSFLTAAAILVTLPETTMTRTTGRFDVLRDRPYALVMLINAVMLLYMPLLSLVIPLWIVQRTEAPTWLAAALLVLNTAAVVLFQVRIARRATGLARASKLVRHAGLVMLASCVVFAATAFSIGAWPAAALLVAAAALQVLGEMMLASGAWEISFSLAPPDRQGQYQGFFGTGTAVARMVGPALLTTVVLGWGSVGWLLVGGLFVLAGYAMGPAVRWAREKNSTSSGATTDDLYMCV